MKKTVSILLLVCLCLSFFSGCGGKNKVVQPENTKSARSETPRTAFILTQTSTVEKETYLGAKAFDTFLSLSERAYLIPGLRETAIPQGMSYCESNGMLYISAYFKEEAPSVILALDAQSGAFAAEYRLFLPDGSAFTGHVGGLAAVGDKLYVSAEPDADGNDTIAAIPLSALPQKGSYEIVLDETLPVGITPSFLSYAQNMLWVGNFYYPKDDYNLPTGIDRTTPTADGESGCYILGYDMRRPDALHGDNGQLPVPDYVLIAPDRIQGMACPNAETVILSQSYGRKNNSTLLRCTLDLNSPQTTAAIGGKQIPAFILDSGSLRDTVTAMPMTEALTLGSDGRVLVLFESGAAFYSNGKYRTDYVWKMDFAS